MTVDVVKSIDQSYKTLDKTMRYDIYRPTDWNGRYDMPAIIWVHGGSWTYGNKEGEEKYATALASLGVTVLVPDYSTTIRPYTGMVDVDNFVSHVLAQSAELHIDLARLSIGGISAGGHLILNELTHRNNIFHCAIAISAPVDLNRLL